MPKDSFDYKAVFTFRQLVRFVLNKEAVWIAAIKTQTAVLIWLLSGN